MPADHIIVTGGTGYIGARLVATARAQGRTVTLLGRRPGPDGAAWTLGDPLPAGVRVAGNTALVHLAHMAPLHGRARLAVERGVDVAHAVMRADFNDVAKALGSHQPAGAAAPREQRVGRDGGAVRELLHLAQRNTR